MWPSFLTEYVKCIQIKPYWSLQSVYIYTHTCFFTFLTVIQIFNSKMFPIVCLHKLASSIYSFFGHFIPCLNTTTILFTCLAQPCRLKVFHQSNNNLLFCAHNKIYYVHAAVQRLHTCAPTTCSHVGGLYVWL